jgi:methionyl-tRNA formyltransferase
MKIAFFGTPEFALPSLDALVASRHEVVLVVTRPDKPVGRKKVMTSPPVAKRARHHGLEVAQPKKIKSGPFPEALRDAGIEAAAVVAYGRIISPELLAIPRLGMVNVHPSLLPRHRGPSPIQWALACGDRFTGVSTMLLDDGMDTGPLLLQERVRIEDREDAEQLGSRLAVLGAELLVKSLDGLEEGSVSPRPQASDGANVTPMLRREFGEVDWSMPAHQLVNRLRAFTPWPGLFTEFRGGRLKLFGLETASDVHGGDEEPGTVLAAEARGIVVRCGRRTALVITEVQREGRRRMPADAFNIGERVATGERFG